MNEFESDLMNLEEKDSLVVWRLAHGLDLRLEMCQRKGLSAEQTFSEIGPWMMDRIGAKGLALLLFDEADGGTVLGCGDRRDALESFLNGGAPEGIFAAVDLVLHDEPIGRMAGVFDTAPDSPGAEVLLDVAAQELDNVLYEYRRARIRHRQVTEMEKLMHQRVLDRSLDSTAAYVIEQTGIEGMVLVYGEDDDRDAPRRIKIYGADGTKKCLMAGDDSALGALLEREASPSAEDIVAAAGFAEGPSCGAPIETGLDTTGNEGILLATGPERSVGGASLELLQHFALTLGRRLVDYHKDRRFLQQFFAPDTVSRLLTHRNYHEEFLSPRLREVAFLYTDITSFTKISEQILDSPSEVGELIDFWSAGVVEILFSHGGAFDKMVGDCVIGLFGTPFNDLTPAGCVEGAVRAALEINRYTAELTGIPEIEKIRCSDLIPGLGVATGVSFGPAMVGTFGPNNAFTAFGRAMNNTARLQGVAGFREVLLMDSAMEVLTKADSGVLEEIELSEEKEAAVKNVALPLKYRVVRSRR